jgi:uncharacterized integral membrane protein
MVGSGSGILCVMAYPSEDRPVSPSGTADQPMPHRPMSPAGAGTTPPGAAEPVIPDAPAGGADDSLMPRPPGASLDRRQDEPTGSGLEAATDGSVADPAPNVDQPIGGESTKARREPIKVTPTRTSAMWLGVWAGVLVFILLIIFVAQNTASVEINFLWMSGRISLALAMLIAGVAGAVIAMAVAAARIIQLRRLVRRAR